MSDAAIIKATFSEWRMVKGRKVLQLVCEVPLEAQEHVLRTLGAPMPDRDTWVAIARLSADVAEQPAIEDKRTSLAQLAGILCDEGAFRRWLAETSGVQGIAVMDSDMAADELRSRCGVTSRRELDTNPDAGRRFREMRAEYDAWLRCAA